MTSEKKVLNWDRHDSLSLSKLYNTVIQQRTALRLSPLNPSVMPSQIHKDTDDTDTSISTDEEGDKEPQADSEEGQDQLEGQYMHFFLNNAITNWDR